jgi:hypothetical protein
MRDQDPVAALIERIVAQARIPGRRRRDELRRELWTHFEDAGTSIDAARAAIHRFGAEAAIGESLRQVYRRDYACWCLARIAASMLASVAAALLIQAVVNVRVEMQADVWRLAPAFWRAAGMTIAVVLGAIAVWEAARPPFSRARAAIAFAAYAGVCSVMQVVFATGIGVCVSAVGLTGIGFLCSKLRGRLSRLLVLAGAFATALYLNHLALHVAFGPSRALVAGAVLCAVWSSTTAILYRFDRVFVNFVEPERSDTV